MKGYNFYIPEGTLVPTELRLKKGDITINYSRDREDSLTWHFTIYDVHSTEEADSIINDIISMMCDQSFDHGAEWRKTSCELVDSNYGYFCPFAKYKVSFRIKDAW